MNCLFKYNYFVTFHMNPANEWMWTPNLGHLCRDNTVYGGRQIGSHLIKQLKKNTGTEYKWICAVVRYWNVSTFFIIQIYVYFTILFIFISYSKNLIFLCQLKKNMTLWALQYGFQSVENCMKAMVQVPLVLVKLYYFSKWNLPFLVMSVRSGIRVCAHC